MNKESNIRDSKELMDLLTLEQIDKYIFRGNNFKTPWNRVFGGQVLAQAIHAAYATMIEGRLLHSMHAYFILAGDINIPIIYQVENLRDGGSFSTRRVTASQNGKAIFILSASFQKSQSGLDHQINMPEVIAPEHLPSDTEIIASFKDKAPALFASLNYERPIEFRPVTNYLELLSKDNEPYQNIWFRAKGENTFDIEMHHQILAYASDYNLLMTATLPHRTQLRKVTPFLASLDHAIWIHRSFDINDWLLYSIDSPSTSNSRGFTRGNIFNKEGDLVASVTQEGLIRIN